MFGDVGGFNDFLLLFLSGFINLYASKAYQHDAVTKTFRKRISK